MSGKVLVVHLGLTGMSFVRYFAEQGWQVDIVDERNAPPALETLRAEFSELTLRKVDDYTQLDTDGYTRVAVSSGIAQQRLPAGLPLWGDVDCFLEGVRQADNKLQLAYITGTNGKSTVTSLVAQIVRGCGVAAEAVGNIGLPLLDALRHWQRDQAWPQWAVAELSSFQLAALRQSLDANVACLLNVTSDHLDWHGSLQAYADAKARVYACAATGIYNAEDKHSCSAVKQAARQLEFGAAGPWPIVDRHLVCRNAPELEPLPCASLLSAGIMPELASAALTIAEQMLPATKQAQMLTQLRQSKGLPHRMTAVATSKGITYVDDSKATNVAAAVAALDALDSSCVLIAGGFGKQQDFGGLRTAVAAKAKAVVLLGSAAPQISAALAASDVPCLPAENMDGAVATAHEQAVQRHARYVLLSPACASTDQFTDYAARGMAFRRAVTACSSC